MSNDDGEEDDSRWFWWKRHWSADYDLCHHDDAVDVDVDIGDANHDSQKQSEHV